MFQRAEEKKYFNRIYFVLSAALLTYVVFRANVLSFTYDECTTFIFIHDKLWYDLFSTANNHLLNSFFIWIISTWFGKSELLLRLPNVLAFVIFLYYLFKILSRLKNSIIKIFGFIFLAANPYILDFFSLARGYGLAMAFCTASLYCVLKEVKPGTEPDSSRSRTCATAFAVLAVLSNMVLLNYLLAIICLFLIKDISGKKFSTRTIIRWTRRNIFSIILMLVLAGILIPVVKMLIEKNALYHGGYNGFWADTVNSLVELSLYDQNYTLYAVLIIKGLIILSMLIFGSLAFYTFAKTRQIEDNTAVFLILILAILTAVFQKLFFNVLLPVQRTALFYIILYGVFLTISFDFLIRIKHLYFFILIAVLFIGALTFHFINTANLKYALHWKLNADIRRAVEQIDAIAEEKKFSLKIGTSWQFAPSLTYYRIKNYSWMMADVLYIPWGTKEENLQSQNRTYDVYLVADGDSAGENFKNQTFVKVWRYPTSTATLYKNASRERESSQ